MILANRILVLLRSFNSIPLKKKKEEGGNHLSSAHPLVLYFLRLGKTRLPVFRSKNATTTTTPPPQKSATCFLLAIGLEWNEVKASVHTFTIYNKCISDKTIHFLSPEKNASIKVPLCLEGGRGRILNTSKQNKLAHAWASKLKWKNVKFTQVNVCLFVCFFIEFDYSSRCNWATNGTQYLLPRSESENMSFFQASFSPPPPLLPPPLFSPIKITSLWIISSQNLHPAKHHHSLCRASISILDFFYLNTHPII